jgi:hypothetical protein
MSGGDTLTSLTDAFVDGPRGAAEIREYVRAAREMARPGPEAVSQVSRAYFRTMDPTVPLEGWTAEVQAAAEELRALYNDMVAGRLGGEEKAGGASRMPRAGADGGGGDDEEVLRENLYPIMDGTAQGVSAVAWQPADSVAYGLGERWRQVLGLSANFAMPTDCRRLYVSPHMAEKTDPLGYPVRLASGYYASTVALPSLTQLGQTGNMIDACKAQLSTAIAKDNACLGRTSDPRCSQSEVRTIGDAVCNTWDGIGNVYLAECDCLKAENWPSGARNYQACMEGVARNEHRVQLSPFETSLTAADCERMNPTSKGPWGLPEGSQRLADPIAQNVLARYVNRAYARLDRFTGRPKACFYPPCSDRFSSYAYTEPQQVFTDLASCPYQKCVASINVNWTTGDVQIAGNMLSVRCDGGPCIKNGLPVCRNRGRCLPLPDNASVEDNALCDCHGTGFKGPTCEDPLLPGEEQPVPRPLRPIDVVEQEEDIVKRKGEAGPSPWKSDYADWVVVGLWVAGALIVGSVLGGVLRGVLGRIGRKEGGSRIVTP